LWLAVNLKENAKKTKFDLVNFDIKNGKKIYGNEVFASNSLIKTNWISLTIQN